MSTKIEITITETWTDDAAETQSGDEETSIRTRSVEAEGFIDDVAGSLVLRVAKALLKAGAMSVKHVNPSTKRYTNDAEAGRVTVVLRDEENPDPDETSRALHVYDLASFEDSYGPYDDYIEGGSSCPVAKVELDAKWYDDFCEASRKFWELDAHLRELFDKAHAAEEAA